jgi:PHD/YefM family antitoxin component YafN of YafNO toxin-antitoxin module
MKISDAVAQANYLVDAEGKKTAVVLPVDTWEKLLSDWERLVEMLEDIEDVEIVRKAFADLEAADGDRRKAGWIAWEDVEKELA